MEAALGKTSIRGVVVALGLLFAVAAGFQFNGASELLFAVTPEPSAGPGAVDSLLAAGLYAAADSTATARLRAVESLSTGGDIRHAIALRDMAAVRIVQDRLEEADGLLATAAPIAEAHQEGGSDLFADILTQRARIAVSLGRHADARPLYEKSLAIETALRGVEDPACGPALTGLATVALIDGDFDEAETLFRRALDLAGSTVNRVPASADAAPTRADGEAGGAAGPAGGADTHADPSIIDAVIGMATTQGYRGDYEAAKATVRPYLETMLAAHGIENGHAVRLMLSLANILAELGEDVESTLLYRQAAAAARATYGPDHTVTAKALAGLAHTYRRVGRGPDARAIYRQCIDIVESRHGSPHPDLVQYRSRLGMSLFEGDRWSTQAGASIERAISEAVALYGDGSYQVALEERQLGLLRVGQFQWDEAAAVFETCLPRLEHYFGPDHPFLSKVLKGMAWSYLHLGRSEEALACAERMVSLENTTGGRDEFELATLLTMKSMIEIDARRYDAAVASAKRAVETAITVQEDNLRISSNREAVLYAVRPWSSGQALVTAAAADPALPDEDWDEVFSLVVRTHGSVLDWQAERRRLLDTIRHAPGAGQPGLTVDIATQHLADLVVTGPGGDTTAYFTELARARRDVEAAERELASITDDRVKTSDFVTLHRSISKESLANALDPGTTVIHFLTFLRVVDSPSRTPGWRTDHYAAFRLSKTDEHTGDLEFIDLGPVISLDSLVAGYRTAVDSVPPGQRPSARDEAEYRRWARALYDRVWAPLFDDSHSVSVPSDHPGGRTRLDSGHTTSSIEPAQEDPPADHNGEAPLVLIIPDSQLHRIDFNTLLSPEGSLVIERWKTQLLSSGGDLLRAPLDRSTGRGMLAAGNPDRNGAGTLNMSPDGSTSTPSEPLPCMDASAVAVPLPGAGREVADVAALFSKRTKESATVLTGADATETRIKQAVRGKRIVHLATHGFVCDEKLMASHSAGSDSIDPLLMCGLVFAPVPGGDDGLLTAQEVTCLDFRANDWVVLSACGSGLGKVIWGEGMFGLRRAFEIAGARTVVMALWRLDDRTACRLMEEIYSRRIAGALTVDAIRDAELTLLAGGRRLNRLHPAVWGGIIAEGDWR